MALARFAPPGNADPLAPAAADQWSEVVKFFFAEALKGHPADREHDAPRPQFFDPTENDDAPDAVEATIRWSAFPRQVALRAPGSARRWELADGDRRLQDEYCEWSVTRANGTITSVQFTCEPREYWHFLALVDDKRVLELYQRYVSPEVTETDLFPNGRYDMDNAWNAGTENGAMHLIHGPNSLSAEIELAAASSIVRELPGRGLLMEAQELIECGDYGEKERNSDPLIGGEVNALARQQADVTLKDPVGLYIDGLSTALFETPDGSDPHDYWSVVRGDPGHAVRAVYTVPEDRGFTVGEIRIDGQPIRFGAQIVDHITMKLVGVACRFGQSDAEPLRACVASRRRDGRMSRDGQVEVPTLGAFELRSRTG